MKTLFLAFAVYLAVPALEVPLFGLSISALLFCFLVFELMLGRGRAAWRPPTHWMLLAGLFWLGCFLSLAGNVMDGRLSSIAHDEVMLLVRFAYWILVFVVTATLMRRQEWGEELAGWLAAGVIALASLRLVEAVAFGYWGGGNPRFLSQNDYGLGFSVFTPFVLWAALETRGARRVLGVLGLATTLIAVAGNGSRSSWVGIVAGASVYLVVAAAAGKLKPRLLPPLLAATALLSAAVWLAPNAVLAPALNRWESLQRLDEDKPFQARRLMVAKGRMLFESSPAFGVGLGRFTKTEAPLDIPPVLAWRPAAYYNRVTPHNAYVKTLAETGLAGIVPLALLLGTLALAGLPAAVSQARAGESWALPAYASFIALSLHLWTLSGLTGTLPWFVYGLIAALIDRRRRKRAIERLRSPRAFAHSVTAPETA